MAPASVEIKLVAALIDASPHARKARDAAHIHILGVHCSRVHTNPDVPTTRGRTTVRSIRDTRGRRQ